MSKRIRTCSVILIAAATATIAPRGSQADSTEATVYDVGVAKVDVTPGYPIRLNGFGGRREESEGITQRIRAKALAIGSDADKPVILVSLDSLGIRESMVDEVARRLKAKAGIQRDRIAVAFSHSHTTPKVNGACDTIFSSPIPPEHQAHIDRYTAELTDAIEEVSLKALADRKPSKLSWAVGKVGFAKNRRTEGGPVDHDLPMMVVENAEDDAVRAIYVTYACHCVTLGDNKISGDWAGYAQEAIERTHPGVIALVSIGCGSDSNPDSGVTGDNTAAAADQGDQIRLEVDRLLAGQLKPISGSISATLAHIDLPLKTLPDRAQLEATAARGGAEGYNAQFQLEKLARGEKLIEKLDYPVQTWAFGDSLAMVFLAGEVCVDYSLRLKEEFTDGRLWMHGYVNDFNAYIPSERLLKEGGYGGGAEVVYFALPATLAAGMEDKIIAEVHRQVPPQFQRQPLDAARQAATEKSLALAVASIKVKDGFVVEVAAAEPLVADPVAIDFGPDGRLWVAEMPDYTRYADEKFPQHGNIRVLTDTDGDGRYDAAEVFADGLRFPTDVKSWRDGVIVCDAPYVLYLEDRDGDGRADVRKVLLTGFATHNAQARVNSLRWGLDNWLHGSCGLFGGDIRTATGRELQLGERDFRFRPDSGDIEGASGRSQQGRARDDWGNWFGCENSSLVDHYPLVDQYLARNPHVTPPANEVSVLAGDKPDQLYPVGTPTTYEMSGPPGRPTAVCGLEIYRDDLLGAEYANNAFVAEPVNNLVHRRPLSPQGSTFSGVRAADEQASEFLASTDPWFRPVQLRTGPDGCLYVVDMYRALIEHPKFIPASDLAKIEIMGGRDHGRIYRIRPRDAAPRPIERLDHRNPAGLVAALDTSNGPQRDLAHQSLVEQHAVSVAPQLRTLARKSKRPVTRLQALCVLDALLMLDADTLIERVSDVNASVRRHAIRLSEPLLQSMPPLADAVLERIDDADPQVKLQLAYSLGELDDPRAASALATLALDNREDPYLLAAVWSSVDRSNVGAIVQHISQAGAETELPTPLAVTTMDLLVELGAPQDVAQITASLTADAQTKFTWKLEAAAALIRRSRQQASSVAATTERLAPLVERAQTLIDEGSGGEREMIAAIGILGVSEPDVDKLVAAVLPLVEPKNPPAIQCAAIDLLATVKTPEARAALLTRWNGATPEVRTRVFDVFLGNAELTHVLLDSLATGDVQPASLDAAQRQRLLEHADESIREKAAAAVAGRVDADRQKVIDQYAASLANDGDASLGRQVFAKHCASCHVLEGVGYEVGPDLAALTTRTPASLLLAVFDPNREIDERYRSYVALTSEGRSHAGILAGETSTSVTLIEQQGQRRTLLRAELEHFENTGKSLMPEGLERDLSPANISDLVAYLTVFGQPPKKVDGNVPTAVAPDYDGTLWLLAANCTIYGESITFEEPTQNIGYWHGAHDHVAWQVDLEQPGEYEVFVHWASPNDAAGSSFTVAGGKPSLHGQVGDTGGFNRYQTMPLGRTELPAGQSRVIVHPRGALSTGHLMDLRGIYLVPAGASTDRAKAGLAPASGEDAAGAIAELVVGMPVGSEEEYKRIPKIWGQAIAAGRRNDRAELLRLLDLSLPKDGEPLADWQAVAIGGGVVNGISQSGAWPRTRIAELLAEIPDLKRRWTRAIELSKSKADDPVVRHGTRYDALRMLGADAWETSGTHLVVYLSQQSDEELQMGAVSGLGDVESPAAAEALVAALDSLSEGNRRLAIAALLRTKERAQLLASATESGLVSRDILTDDEMKQLSAKAAELIR